MKIRINNNQIKFDTGKALLVSIPKSNDKFWIPSSLAYPNSWYTTLYIPDDMIFNCIKGKNTKFTLEAEELTERLTDVVSSIPIKQIHVIHNVPDKKEAVHIEADDDLIR